MGGQVIFDFVWIDVEVGDYYYVFFVVDDGEIVVFIYDVDVVGKELVVFQDFGGFFWFVLVILYYLWFFDGDFVVFVLCDWEVVIVDIVYESCGYGYIDGVVVGFVEWIEVEYG